MDGFSQVFWYPLLRGRNFCQINFGKTWVKISLNVQEPQLLTDIVKEEISVECVEHFNGKEAS